MLLGGRRCDINVFSGDREKVPTLSAEVTLCTILLTLLYRKVCRRRGKPGEWLDLERPPPRRRFPYLGGDDFDGEKLNQPTLRLGKLRSIK